MRFLILMMADKDTEAGVMPDEQILTAMTDYNEELVKAGVMLSGEGLHPTSKGARVHFEDGKPRVVDGPFAESKELIAGFWMWQCKSLDEAKRWVEKCPRPPKGEMRIEIRQVFEMADFGAELTPELRAKEESQRERIEANARKAAKK